MNLNESEIMREFLDQSIKRMEESTEKIRSCLGMLDDAYFWYRPNTSSNSVGQMLAHLSGNIRQYILSGLTQQPDTRQRDLEFVLPEEKDRTAVESEFFGVVDKAIQVIDKVQADRILARRKVQGFDLSGLGIILHVVEHLSYHTGQVAYLTKMLLDTDLGFYRGIDLNEKNE